MNFEDHAAFLESLDGKKRDLKLLEHLSTAQGRLDFALQQVIQKNGVHRYRALFDLEYRKRSNPGRERLGELDEEFINLTNSYHKQALVYYHGPTEEEHLIIAMKEDRMDVERSIMEGLQGMSGGAPPKDDNWGLDLDDWMKN